MRRIKMIVDDIHEELEGALHYAECFVQAKSDGDPAMAERFRSMSEDELRHATVLHDRAVSEIEKLEEHYHPTSEMKDGWDKAHREYIRKHEWIEEMLGVG